MDVEIIELTIRPNQFRIGFGLLRYYELYMRFDLCYYAAANKVWVRMPEKWLNPKRKIHYCHWDNKTVSDKFQILTIKKIFDKFDLNEAKVVEIYQHAKSQKAEQRKE